MPSTAARTSERGIELDVDGLGTLCASFAVGADGMWSPLRKALGASEPGYLGEWHAFRQYFSHVGPAAAGLWVWFDADILPGYAWSFPLPGGRANVGFGIPPGWRHRHEGHEGAVARDPGPPPRPGGAR